MAIETRTRTYKKEITFGEVFDSLQSFYNHEFMMYGFVVGEDDEMMRNFVCKPFCLCQKLSFLLNLLKRKILCS